MGGRFPKPLVWRLLGDPNWGELGYLGMIQTDEVRRFHRSQTRIRIPCAPARTSKSMSTAFDVAPECLPDWEYVGGKLRPVAPRSGQHTKLVWLVAPSYTPNKEFDYLWTEFVIRQKRNELPYKLGRHSYSPKQGNLEIELIWGRDRHGDPIRTLIEGKSATNPEALQAEEVDIWVSCEAAEHSPTIWQRYGATRARTALFPTTPKLSGAWLKEMIDMAEGLAHLPECDVLCHPACPVIGIGVEAFEFTPHCNPTYDWDRFWKEHQQAERRVEGRAVIPPHGHNCFDRAVDCRAMRDPWFAEQFGGRWTFEADRVIPFKWMPLFPGDWSHVLDTVPEWIYSAKHVVAVDYGFTDPACVHWYAVGGDGQMLLYREIYEPGLDVRRLVERIIETNRKFGERIDYYVGDPQKPEVASIYRQFGLPVIERNKAATRDRAAGHLRLVNALTPNGDQPPRLQVLSERAGHGYGCPKTIAEWRALRRKPGTVSSEFSAAALIGPDHAFDTARYFISSRPSTPERQTMIDREMRELRLQADRFRVSTKHSGPLAGQAPRHIYAA